MYFNQSGPDAFEGTLWTWDQVMGEEDNDVIDELQAADQIINFTWKSTVKGKSALQSPYKTDIRQIAEMFTNIQNNRHPLQRAFKGVSIKKTVTFQNEVIVHRLVWPDIFVRNQWYRN